MKTIRFRFNFSHTVITKSPGLLPMKYTVKELSNELNISNRTLRDWLSKGAPHLRDNRKHIWIIGSEFANWVQKNRKIKASGRKLKNDEAYCMRCKKPVKISNPNEIPIKGKLIRLTGYCPKCGCKINRGGRHGSFS